jgi:hypothetical protein
MIRRKLVAVVLATAGILTTTGAPAANASVFVGTCELRVIFSFGQPIGPATTVRSYTVTIAPLVNGQMPCQSTEDGVEVQRHTWVESTAGTSSVWSCGAVAAEGNWRQRWTKANGTFSPPMAVGSHHVTGTWGSWTVPLVGVQPVEFAGVIELSLDPLSAAQQTQQCLSGTLTQLRTVGVQVFEDPKLP